jgi:hypothetical protein
MPPPSALEEARLACALRRLPSFQGAVFCPANLPKAGAQAYLSGQTVVEPSFIIATSSLAISCNGRGEYVIWSETGKRIAALAVGARPDEVIFTPGDIRNSMAGRTPGDLFAADKPGSITMSGGCRCEHAQARQPHKSEPSHNSH